MIRHLQIRNPKFKVTIDSFELGSSIENKEEDNNKGK